MKHLNTSEFLGFDMKEMSLTSKGTSKPQTKDHQTKTLSVFWYFVANHKQLKMASSQKCDRKSKMVESYK